ncbi:hypothetical protein [Streptomyces sp. NPDC052721]|uniref:hypothetical protein n=1 Tax=Streptomyces sp. NPDC052721 TaxID=3154955 RepID=UPI0034148E0A
MGVAGRLGEKALSEGQQPVCSAWFMAASDGVVQPDATVGEIPGVLRSPASVPMTRRRC